MAATATGLTASVEGKGAEKVLVIRVPLNAKPVPSATGKTLVVASSRGNQTTDVQVEGKNVVVGVNAYIKL